MTPLFTQAAFALMLSICPIGPADVPSGACVDNAAVLRVYDTEAACDQAIRPQAERLADVVGFDQALYCVAASK